jgi:hypothetical protein
MRHAQAKRALGRAQRSGDTAAAAKAAKELDKAWKGRQYAAEAERMGLTSLPGYLKSLARDPVKTLKTGFGEQWHSQGPAMKALTFGTPLGLAAMEAAPKTQEGGPGRFERGLRGLAGGLAFAAAPNPLAGSLGLTAGAEQAGGLVGAGVDRQRRMAALREQAQQAQGAV